MKKKIIITGGLGYIGTELCKLYSGFSWKFEVIAIDNRFVSERVNELKRRKIKFIQADILNLDSIKKYIENAEVIHHLARQLPTMIGKLLRPQDLKCFQV